MLVTSLMFRVFAFEVPRIFETDLEAGQFLVGRIVDLSGDSVNGFVNYREGFRE